MCVFTLVHTQSHAQNESASLLCETVEAALGWVFVSERQRVLLLNRHGIFQELRNNVSEVCVCEMTHRKTFLLVPLQTHTHADRPFSLCERVWECVFLGGARFWPVTALQKEPLSERQRESRARDIGGCCEPRNGGKEWARQAVGSGVGGGGPLLSPAPRTHACVSEGRAVLLPATAPCLAGSAGRQSSTRHVGRLHTRACTLTVFSGVPVAGGKGCLHWDHQGLV